MLDATLASIIAMPSQESFFQSDGRKFHQLLRKRTYDFQADNPVSAHRGDSALSSPPLTNLCFNPLIELLHRTHTANSIKVRLTFDVAPFPSPLCKRK